VQGAGCRGVRMCLLEARICTKFARKCQACVCRRSDRRRLAIFHQDIEIFVYVDVFPRLYLDNRQINPVLNEYYLKQEVFADWENSILEISFRFTKLGVPDGWAVEI